MNYSASEVGKYIKSDVYRYYGKCDTGSILLYYAIDSVIRFHVAFRMCQGRGVVKLTGNILWRFNGKRKTIKLYRETKVGYGLYIGHGGPVVVNPTATLGNNVNLSPYDVIGSNMGRAAIVGDCTYIGPNVCLVDDVCVGSNVTIGAGAVVTKDIPDNATACGNYAKVINYNNPGRYIGNRWNCD